jgi:hypothetical protein
MDDWMKLLCSEDVNNRINTTGTNPEENLKAKPTRYKAIGNASPKRYGQAHNVKIKVPGRNKTMRRISIVQ